MNKSFNYDFLILEFKNIYDDLEDLDNVIKDKNIEKIRKKIEVFINDIIFLIYKKNKILYNEKLDYISRLNSLKEINIIPLEIYMKIIAWIEMVINSIDDVDSKDDINFIDDNNLMDKALYEILVWFVINYGEENYELILDNIVENEKQIFKRYLPNDKEQQEKSLTIYSEISNIDDSDVANSLVEKGENFYFGRGVKKDEKQAYKYFLDAARYRNEYAESYLGLFYDKGIAVNKNYDIAYQWYFKAATKGNAFSQYSLGVLYSEGNGVIKDYNKAFIWFQKSAENDYAAAFYQLGKAYYNGYGVDVDFYKAFKWYKKAAEDNFPAAQYALSLMYKNGEGCDPNVVSAYYWVERAAENDYEDAYYIIGRSYLEGICVDVDYKKAFYYLNKGYRALDTNCIESLAGMYLKGLGIKKDICTAIELYNKAIEFGDKSLYFKVGKVYEDQELINQAVLIYEKGHSEGNLKCTQRLGVMYYNGEGVEKDLEKAIEYMAVAAAKKEPHAMYVLAVAYLRLNKFGEKTTEIVKSLLREAIELKSPYAADYMASIMINELKEGKTVDKSELVRYIRFGVENGVENSVYQYGYIHEKGIGVEQDYEKAYSYYNLSAENNCVKSMVKLGDWYKRGIFLNRNIQLSIKWYEYAVAAGDIEAIERLIEIYELGIGNRKSDIKAIYYVFKLIDLDAIKGKEKLAYYCFKGIGVEENKEKGFEIIQDIEEVDKGEANYLRGILAEDKLIEMTKEEIINLYKEGIELGNLKCYGQLASYLYNNKLDSSSEYEELFKEAIEGRKLGVVKCDYIYVKEKLKGIQTSSIVTLEEMIIIKQISRFINKGIYEAINDLIEWYSIRKPEDKYGYYELMEEAIYYGIIKE